MGDSEYGHRTRGEPTPQKKKAAKDFSRAACIYVGLEVSRRDLLGLPDWH